MKCCKMANADTTCKHNMFCDMIHPRHSEMRRFIDFWRDQDSLWNPANEDYNKFANRELAYKAIAVNMGSGWTVEGVKSKINNLRTSYSRVLKKYYQSRSHGVDALPTWRYFKPMEFLREVIGSRLDVRKKCEAFDKVYHDQKLLETPDIKSTHVHTESIETPDFKSTPIHSESSTSEPSDNQALPQEDGSPTLHLDCSPCLSEDDQSWMDDYDIAIDRDEPHDCRAESLDLEVVKQNPTTVQRKRSLSISEVEKPAKKTSFTNGANSKTVSSHSFNSVPNATTHWLKDLSQRLDIMEDKKDHHSECTADANFLKFVGDEMAKIQNSRKKSELKLKIHKLLYEYVFDN